MTSRTRVGASLGLALCVVASLASYCRGADPIFAHPLYTGSEPADLQSPPSDLANLLRECLAKGLHPNCLPFGVPAEARPIPSRALETPPISTLPPAEIRTLPLNWRSLSLAPRIRPMHHVPPLVVRAISEHLPTPFLPPLPKFSLEPDPAWVYTLPVMSQNRLEAADSAMPLTEPYTLPPLPAPRSQPLAGDPIPH